MEKDKKIPVIISITGLHSVISEPVSDPDPESDETKENARGFFSKRQNTVYLIYDLNSGKEDDLSLNGISEDTVIGNCMVKISESPFRVEVKRNIRKSVTCADSLLQTRSFYEQGVFSSGFHETPFGIIETGNMTETISVFETDNSFSCMIKGTLYINNSPASEFTLKIEAVKL